MAKRRAHLRTLLSQARGNANPADKAFFAEQAADILLSFFRKPKSALALYRFAAQYASDPASILKAIEEIQVPVPNPVDSRIQTADALIEGRPPLDVFKQRLAALMPRIEQDEALREEVLSTLRACEYYDGMEHLLRELAAGLGPAHARGLLFELGYILRFGRGDLVGAVSCLEELVAANPMDREAWGELLECLDDLGDQQRLSVLLEQRIPLTSGLEQRELIRQRDGLLKPG